MSIPHREKENNWVETNGNTWKKWQEERELIKTKETRADKREIDTEIETLT